MTIELPGRSILDDGTVVCDQSALVDLLYQGKQLAGIVCADPTDESEWKSAALACDDDERGPATADASSLSPIDWYEFWFTPPPYDTIDVRQHCLARCSTAEEIARINLEMLLMEERAMLPVLRHLIYCVDEWRKAGIFWGVGRGSSVCSLVLYKIGINRIDPLVHGLDINEWLK